MVKDETEGKKANSFMKIENSFLELIKEYYKEKTPIFINGMGIGKITKIHRNHLDFEVIRKTEETTGTGKNRVKEKKLFKETINIPHSKVTHISLGEQEIAKPKEDKAIEQELDEVFN